MERLDKQDMEDGFLHTDSPTLVRPERSEAESKDAPTPPFPGVGTGVSGLTGGAGACLEIIGQSDKGR